MRQQIIINIDVNPTEPIEIPDLHALHAGFEKSIGDTWMDEIDYRKK